MWATRLNAIYYFIKNAVQVGNKIMVGKAENKKESVIWESGESPNKSTNILLQVFDLSVKSVFENTHTEQIVSRWLLQYPVKHMENLFKQNYNYWIEFQTLRSNFSFCQNVFKRHLLQTRQKESTYMWKD